MAKGAACKTGKSVYKTGKSVYKTGKSFRHTLTSSLVAVQNNDPTLQTSAFLRHALKWQKMINKCCPIFGSL
jgi:hypothetical protein